MKVTFVAHQRTHIASDNRAVAQTLPIAAIMSMLCGAVLLVAQVLAAVQVALRATQVLDTTVVALLLEMTNGFRAQFSTLWQFREVARLVTKMLHPLAIVAA